MKIELLDFMQEVYSENIPAMQALIRAGIDVNSYISQEDTILMLAVRHRCNDAIKVLINAGADLNGRNGWQETPLIIAAYARNKKMIKVLVDAGADVNAKSNHGTALYFAEKFSKQTIDNEIIEILKTAGRLNISTSWFIIS